MGLILEAVFFSEGLLLHADKQLKLVCSINEVDEICFSMIDPPPIDYYSNTVALSFIFMILSQ